MMQIKHEINYKYKGHNLCWQDWKVVSFKTSYYIIKWNFLKDHQPFKNIYQLNFL
jgi:hypothetical protein